MVIIEDRGSIVSNNHHDLTICDITTGDINHFSKLFWLHFESITCFIDHALLIQNQTSLAEGYSIWMMWKPSLFQNGQLSLLHDLT